jgi:hypothetical protein
VELRVNGWPKSYSPEAVQANHLIELRILDTALKANGSQNGERIALVFVGSATSCHIMYVCMGLCLCVHVCVCAVYLEAVGRTHRQFISGQGP